MVLDHADGEDSDRQRQHHLSQRPVPRLCTGRAPNGLQSMNVRLLAAPRPVEVAPPSHFRHYAFGFGPDENYFYYTEDRPRQEGIIGALFRVPLLGGPRQRIIENIQGLAISPDGSRLAFVRSNSEASFLWTADPDGANQRQVALSHEIRPFYSYCWSYHHTTAGEIFYMEGSQTSQRPRLVHARSEPHGGSSHAVASFGRAAITTFRQLPDGSGFVANAIDPEANNPQIWRISRPAMSRITHDFNEYQGLTMTSDGRRIVTNQAQRESALWVIDVRVVR